MSSNPPVKGEVDHLPMSVDKLGFLLDRLGQDCAPLQFLRELTQNGKEAIIRTGEEGSIVWDVDWNLFDLSDEGVMKLCVIDTGDGMDAEEMLRFINQLSSSGQVQSMSANYGVGAKIAAATRNPAGVVYQSWKGGEGYMVHLEKGPDGEYGFRRFEHEDGTYDYYLPLDDAVKPKEIDQHGTKVILFGDHIQADTLTPPKEAAAPSRWVSKYLNTRYYQFPEGVQVKAREGWENPRADTDRNVLRTITGQRPYLDAHAEESGTVNLADVRIHWWILKDEPAMSNNSGFIESAGHVAALYQDELYDRSTGRGATALLQQFGVLFGARFVVIYAEPVNSEGYTLTTNTARTTLLVNGAPLPWSDWAHEFRRAMPEELVSFVNSMAPKSEESDHVKSIKERLKGIMDLYKVSRYRPSPKGFYLSDDSSRSTSNTSDDAGRKSKGGGGSGGQAGTGGKGLRDHDLGNIYNLFEKKGGTKSDKKEADPFPNVTWVSKEDGSRAEDDLEDRAARYLQDQNTLLINADFRVFTDMVVRLCKEKQTTKGLSLQGIVTDVVRQWFEQALIETVIGMQQLRGSKEWGQDKLKDALSEEALTAAVMQRYHVHIACRRDLGAKLGKTGGAG